MQQIRNESTYMKFPTWLLKCTHYNNNKNVLLYFFLVKEKFFCFTNHHQLMMVLQPNKLTVN